MKKLQPKMKSDIFHNENLPMIDMECLMFENVDDDDDVIFPSSSDRIY